MSKSENFFIRYKWALDRLAKEFGEENVTACRLVEKKIFAINAKYKGKSNTLILYKTNEAGGVTKSFNKTAANEEKLSEFIADLKAAGETNEN